MQETLEPKGEEKREHNGKHPKEKKKLRVHPCLDAHGIA